MKVGPHTAMPDEGNEKIKLGETGLSLTLCSKDRKFILIFRLTALILYDNLNIKI